MVILCVPHAKQLGVAYCSNDAGDGPAMPHRIECKRIDALIMVNNVNGLDGNLHFDDIHTLQKRIPRTAPMMENMYKYMTKFTGCHAPEGLLQKPLAWCINETWMPDGQVPEKISGMTYFGRSRTDAKMGGVAVLVHNDYVRRFQAKIATPPRSRTPVARVYQEIIWVEYKLTSRDRLFIAAVHMPAAKTLTSLGTTTGEMVEQLVEQIRHFRQRGTVIIGGDFNMLRKDSAMIKIERAIAGDKSQRAGEAYLSADVPTRPKSNRAIDHILWSGSRKGAKCQHICEAAACEDINTDHIGIGVLLKIKVDKRRLRTTPGAYVVPAPQQKKSPPFDVRQVWGDGDEATVRRQNMQASLETWAENDDIWRASAEDPQRVYTSVIQKVVEALKVHAAPDPRSGNRKLPGLTTRRFRQAVKQKKRFSKRLDENQGCLRARAAYRTNLKKIQKRIQSEVDKAKNKLSRRRKELLSDMACAAQGNTCAETARLYKAAKECAGVSERMRGIENNRVPPLVCDKHGCRAKSTKESAENFRDQWEIVGKDKAQGAQAEEWKAAYQRACEEARAESQTERWEPIKKKELMKAIAKCKNKKSPGPDRIPYEVWKLMPVGVLYRIAQLFDQFVIQNKTPTQWEVAKGTPLFKKGDAADAYMYRIISLTDTLFKIYERVILARITPIVNQHLSEHQHGFRKGRNTEGAGLILATATGMGQTRHESQRHGRTYVAFIDIRKAYPTAYRPAMLAKLKRAGVSGHLFRAVEATYHKVQSSIQVGDEVSTAYNVEQGVREGSVLSPVLYSIFINDLLTRIQATGEGVTIAGDPTCAVAVLGYADDLVLVSRSGNGLQKMLDIVADHAEKNFYQISQSKSKVVVFGEDDTQAEPANAMWVLHGMYNDDKDGMPDHIEETEKYQYLGTWFHRDRTWATQFQQAAGKFWKETASKWMEAGAIRMGAGELVANKMWNSLAAPAVEYDPLVTISSHANAAALKVMKPIKKVTKAARQAATGGREHCSEAARMATGIQDEVTRRSVRCATAVAKIMKLDDTDMRKKVLRYAASGAAGCKRMKQGLSQVAHRTATEGVIDGWRKPSTVNARDATKDCIAAADAETRQAASERNHVRESLEIYDRIRKTHGKAVLPRRTLCGDYLGQMVHQQIRASATRFNAYTGRYNRECTHAQCQQKRETNKHAVVQCQRYATMRRQFQLETGIVVTEANYVDIMALNATVLGVPLNTLATALCRFLAHIAKVHKRENHIASVAVPLGCNQRRSIIRTNQSEQEPD